MNFLSGLVNTVFSTMCRHMEWRGEGTGGGRGESVFTVANVMKCAMSSADIQLGPSKLAQG